MKITAKSHPLLFAAFTFMDFDSGRNLVREAPAEFDIPQRGEHMVVPAERALAALTEDERETCAAGDQDEADKLYDALGSNGDHLKMILAEHFTDWCAGSNPEGA